MTCTLRNFPEEADLIQDVDAGLGALVPLKVEELWIPDLLRPPTDGEISTCVERKIPSPSQRDFPLFCNG